MRACSCYAGPVLDFPQWAHELATLATLAAASGYLAVHLARVTRPRGGTGCARCEHGLTPVPVTAPAHGRRSRQLRVIR